MALHGRVPKRRDLPAQFSRSLLWIVAAALVFGGIWYSIFRLVQYMVL